MKLFPSVLAVITVPLMSSAFAQQMVSPPGQISGSPEPVAESTSETTVSPAAAEEKPAATSESAAQNEASAPVLPKSRDDMRVAKPARAKKKKAVPQAETPAARPPRKSDVAASLREMEKRWEAAVAAHDTRVVEELVAPDFSGVNSKGRFVNKAGLLAELKNDTNVYTSARNERLTVRVYGPSAAVVTGSARARGMNKEGVSFDRTYRFTDTWVERDGKWQCVASQNAVLVSRR